MLKIGQKKITPMGLISPNWGGLISINTKQQKIKSLQSKKLSCCINNRTTNNKNDT